MAPPLRRRPRGARLLAAAALCLLSSALPAPAALGATTRQVTGTAAAPAPPPGPLSTVGGVQLAETGRVVADPAVPPPPAVQARSYVVADADTGQVLAALNPHWKLRPASTLKTLFALVVLPQLDPNQTYVGQEMDPSLAGTSLVGIAPGVTYTVGQLWNGMFLVSGNDAVVALAQLAGGVPKVVGEMQAEAQRLGAMDTTVVNPDGLDADGQYSSAYDLTLIARAALARPDFRRYCSLVTAMMPGKGGTSYQIQNQDHLLTKYPGAIGVKTGYTTLAQNTFIGAATRNGHTLIVTMMDSPPGIQDDDQKLLDWGFGVVGHAQPVGSLVAPSPSAAPGPQVTAPVVANRQVENRAAGQSVLGTLGLCVVAGAAVAGGILAARRRRGAGREGPAADPTATTLPLGTVPVGAAAPAPDGRPAAGDGERAPGGAGPEPPPAVAAAGGSGGSPRAGRPVPVTTTDDEEFADAAGRGPDGSGAADAATPETAKTASGVGPVEEGTESAAGDRGRAPDVGS